MRGRKHMRYRLRIAAEKAHVKPSKHVNYGWDNIQQKEVGWTVRQVNKAKGSKPKRKWKNRIAGVV